MSKPALSVQDQLAKLKDRGLTVRDEVAALHVLTHHNYYRFSAYRFPFTKPENPDVFLEGTDFQDLWDLYQFDWGLRQLVLEGCKRVEISARSRWAYETAHILGPLGYLESGNFLNPDHHRETLDRVEKEMNRSKEVFIKHHKDDLKMPWPPAWVISEVASFGNISSLVGQLKSPSLRQKIADTYGLDEKVFCSLLHHLTVIRNTAAHHSRLWNRSFTLTSQLPKKKPLGLAENFHINLSASGNLKERRLYNSLVLLIYLSDIIEPGSTWPRRLFALLKTQDFRFLGEMDFPGDWKERPLWVGLDS